MEKFDHTIRGDTIEFRGTGGGDIMRCLYRVGVSCPLLVSGVVAAFKNIVSQKEFATDVRGNVVRSVKRVRILAQVMNLYRMAYVNENFLLLWNFCRTVHPDYDPGEVDLVNEVASLRATREEYKSHGYLRALFVRAVQDITSDELRNTICSSFDFNLGANLADGLLELVYGYEDRMSILKSAVQNYDYLLNIALANICEIAAPAATPATALPPAPARSAAPAASVSPVAAAASAADFAAPVPLPTHAPAPVHLSAPVAEGAVREAVVRVAEALRSATSAAAMKFGVADPSLGAARAMSSDKLVEAIPFNCPGLPNNLGSIMLRTVRQGGIGNFGEVFICEVNGIAANRVAVKLLNTVGDEELLTEAAYLHLARCDHVVSLHGLYHIREQYAIVTEALDHSLEVELQNGRLRSTPGQMRDLEKTVQVLQSVANGLTVIHGLNIVHRDIAARNILVRSSGTDLLVRLADFGLTRTAPYARRSFTTGRPPETAPEVLYDGEAASTKSDIWSFGILVWGMFADLKKDMLAGLNAENKYLAPAGNIPAALYWVVAKCCMRSPVHRPDAPELVHLLGCVSKILKSPNHDLLRPAEHQVGADGLVDLTVAIVNDKIDALKAAVPRYANES